MKKGLIFTLEVLFLAGVMLSLLFLQIKPIEETGQQTKTNLMNAELSVIKYNQNQITEPILSSLVEKVCKTTTIYDYDTNKIITKRFCKVN